MLIIFFDTKGNVHKEFLLTGQTVNSTNYCDILRWPPENVRRLRPELRWQKNWLLHHDSALSRTSFFTREFLTKNNMTVAPLPTLLFSNKTERPPFWHNWGDRGIIAGGAEHPHRTRHSKNGRSAGNNANVRKGTTLRVMVVSSLRVSFWSDCSTSPGNYGWLLV
jgi:hypothetical protein